MVLLASASLEGSELVTTSRVVYGVAGEREP